MKRNWRSYKIYYNLKGTVCNRDCNFVRIYAGSRDEAFATVERMAQIVAKNKIEFTCFTPDGSEEKSKHT